MSTALRAVLLRPWLVFFFFLSTYRPSCFKEVTSCCSCVVTRRLWRASSRFRLCSSSKSSAPLQPPLEAVPRQTTPLHWASASTYSSCHRASTWWWRIAQVIMLFFSYGTGHVVIAYDLDPHIWCGCKCSFLLFFRCDPVQSVATNIGMRWAPTNHVSWAVQL